LGKLRYIHFIIIFLLVFFVVYFLGYSLTNTSGFVSFGAESGDGGKYNSIFEIPQFWIFIIGNLLYYLSGIILAYVLKDNRAFCKYLCPIPGFSKLSSRYSLLKIEANRETCINCKRCDITCPMDIRISEYIKNDMRITSSECILCLKCINDCPTDSLNITSKIDKKPIELLRYKEWPRK